MNRNSNLVPMINGFARAVTPSAARPSVADGAQIFEFLIPYPILMVDPVGWPNLSIEIGGARVHLLRPMMTSGWFEPGGRIGNESPESFCTILRCVALASEAPTPEAVWSVLEDRKSVV